MNLYHGTTKVYANMLMRDGWIPNQVTPGANQGQPQFLYLTTEIEDAIWFSEEKGERVVLELVDVPLEYLKVDPEDGVYDTVEEEI